MKKILVLALSLVLLMSLATMPAYAAASTQELKGTETFSARATTQGLWYRENLTLITGSVTAKVTPESGSALNVWLKCDGPIGVKVYKGSSLIASYSKTFDAGERDVQVVNRCTGDSYRVVFSAEGGTCFSALVYQH